MTVNTTWISPSGAVLDKTVGDVIVEAMTDGWSSDLLRLGGTDGDTKTGNLKFADASAKIIAGATSLLVRNAADSASNVVITDAGEITTPLQPAFLAYNSATDVNQTGNGATATVDFDTEVFDQGADFASDTFTAPVTGRYLLATQVVATDLTAAMTGLFLSIVTSNRTYTQAVNTVPIATGSFGLCLAVLADMDAGDTATVTLRITGGAGDTADIFGGAAPIYTYFSGELAA